MTDQCCNCGKDLDPNEEHQSNACDECIKDCGDILKSEECRHYGTPYLLQIWTDVPTVGNEGYGDVEITCVNYSTVCFKHPKDGHTVPMRREDFERWFSFKDTVY
jgi:predicted RNA-binding Zn-ribbon protein involved in translation (DUF1610 family)